MYHYWRGWNWRAYVAYVVGVAPNFYGFLNNMGVHAPGGVTKVYYFAYEIGLVASFFTYWAACWLSPPALMVPLKEWREPVDYVRPEDCVEVVLVEDVEGYSESVGGEKRGVVGGKVDLV